MSKPIFSVKIYARFSLDNINKIKHLLSEKSKNSNIHFWSNSFELDKELKSIYHFNTNCCHDYEAIIINKKDYAPRSNVFKYLEELRNKNILIKVI